MQASLSAIYRYPHWRQCIPLTEDWATPGYLNCPNWETLSLPVDLSGKTFLDVGANDGFYSFQAEKKGASRVVATDLYEEKIKGSSSGTGWPLEGIHLAKKHLQSKVEVIPKSIYDLGELDASFDFVFCSNVLAWLRDVPKAIESLSDVCSDTLILQDGLLDSNNKEAVLRYEVDKPYLYRPNKEFIKANLQELGFRHIDFRKITTPVDTLYSFPRFRIDSEAPIYADFETLAHHKTIGKPQEGLGIYQIGNRRFLHKIGWVEDRFTTQLPYTRNLVRQAVEPVIGTQMYQRWKTQWLNRKQDWSNYIVVASR